MNDFPSGMNRTRSPSRRLPGVDAGRRAPAADGLGAAAPRSITDDFLKLLEDSFARDWRKPRTWPWTRVARAYGFALAGVTSAVGLSLLMVAPGCQPGRRPPAMEAGVTDRVWSVEEIVTLLN